MYDGRRAAPSVPAANKVAPAIIAVLSGMRSNSPGKASAAGIEPPPKDANAPGDRLLIESEGRADVDHGIDDDQGASHCHHQDRWPASRAGGVCEIDPHSPCRQLRIARSSDGVGLGKTTDITRPGRQKADHGAGKGVA